MSTRGKTVDALVDKLLTSLKDGRIDYSAGHYGKRRYDPDTGEAYITHSEPARVILYGATADTLEKLRGEVRKLNSGGVNG